MNTKILLFLLMTGLNGTWSQPLLNSKRDIEYCARENRLGYMGSTDSTRHQVVLDSVSRLLVGQWQLVDIGMKIHNVMPVPGDSITMSIDGQGNTTAYVRGKKLIDFQLAAGINYGQLRCVISEGGRDYFHLKTSLVSNGQGGLDKGKPVYRNGIRVCEDYLELYGFTSAGPYYVFKRLRQ